MKYARAGILLGMASVALAREMPPPDSIEDALYASGKIHDKVISMKEATWGREIASGAMNSSHYHELGFTPCKDGKAEAVPGDASNTFKCSNLDLYSFRSHMSLGSPLGEGSSSWGWTSDDGREFVAIGQTDGTAFAEILKNGTLSYLGRLPAYSHPIIWREIRGYKNYMIIGSEALNHGVQIFDMNKLLDQDPRNPKLFSNEKDLTSHWNDLPVGRTHNVVINEEKSYIASVGALPRNSTCRAGLIFIDMSDPASPTTSGCAAQDGYVHDAQCLVYKGPDSAYTGRDICYGYNEDTLTIYDVTDKKNTSVISRTSYEGATYTHQGAVLDPEWQDYLVMDDEYDELERAGPASDGKAVTYIWDVSSLKNPKQTGVYKSSVPSIDHNQYITDGLSYQSNYGAGLRVVDVSSIRKDPTGNGVKEVAFFDIYPEDDEAEGGGEVDFFGAWSSYGPFKSGYIYVNTIERGGFVVKRNDL